MRTRACAHVHVHTHTYTECVAIKGWLLLITFNVQYHALVYIPTEQWEKNKETKQERAVVNHLV